jgi:hypothetical protein
MGRKLVIKGADFSSVAVDLVKGTPVINVTRGNVTIEAVGSRYIYYTTNGSTPTQQSAVYTGHFTVEDNTVIKTIAEYEDGTISEVVTYTYTMKTYIFGISDSLFTDASKAWDDSTTRGYALRYQEAMQGKTLDGIRLNVATIGTLNIYKSSVKKPTDNAQMTKVAEVTASTTGIHDLQFSTPVELGANEYIIFGSSSDDDSFSAMYNQRAETPIPFYYKCGQANATLSASSAFLVDFYTIN